MDWWFLRDPQRLIEERQAVDELAAQADWLAGVEWQLDKSVAICADVLAHGHSYTVRLTYPAHFPFAPPAVRPAQDGQRWSGHQYLDGTLCLEWGPDTWRSDVTAAQVLESVYRLLDTENPLGDSGSVAPSRHQLTTGQSLRGQTSRVYLSPDLVDALTRLEVGTTGAVEGRFQFQGDISTLFVQAVRPLDGVALSDPSLPSGLRGDVEQHTMTRGVFAVGVSAEGINGEALQLLFDSARESVAEGERRTRPGDEPWRPTVFVLADSVQNVRCFWAFGGRVHEEDEFGVVASGPDRPRTPVELAELGDKKIAIVGLGSLGAAVALSLARMGVKNFLLVDDDLLLPENLCRHPLDWTGVGLHKADAVAGAIHRLVTGVRVDVSRHNLTGQENAASQNSLLKRLGKRDVIIDMTANPDVFNLLTAVAVAEAKPLVWAEVFAGGVGGLVARSRPGKDPEPQTMRAALAAYSVSREAPEFIADTDYGAISREGNVFVASAADVAVLAAHATGVAADCALEREPSRYPHSMYLIGLTRGWVFDAPFHTIPIATDHLIATESSKATSKEALAEMVEFVTKTLRRKDGTPSA